MKNNSLTTPIKIISIVWALLLGVFVRSPYLISNYLFPLGDGGLFAAIIKAIQANSYLLPETISYNSLNIPFAYPPLGFYLVLITSKILGMPTLWVFRFLPMAFSLLTIVSFVLLAFELVKDRNELLVCSTIFPIVFEAYEWHLKGGGITRSPGFFFMITTLLFLVLYQKKEKPLYLALVIISLSAAVLSHAEWGVISIASILAYLLTHDLQNWRGHIRVFVMIGFGSLVLTSPWWVTVILRHGITPMLMAGQSIAPQQFFDYLSRIFSITITPRADFLIPWLAAIGILVSLAGRDWFLPLWLLLIFLADARNTPKAGVVPLVFLIAVGLQGIDSLFSYLLSLIRGKNKEPILSRVLVSQLYLLVVLLLLFIGWENKPFIASIQQNNLNAMKFIADKTPQDAKFVVVTQFNWYESDTAEWFPYLTGRQSLTTPQGLEWVSSAEFRKMAKLADDLSVLARNEELGSNNIEIYEYVEKNFPQFDYVVIFVNDADENFGGFQDTGRYDIVFQKKNVVIFEAMQNIK